jgi:4-hydroxy-2-oxoheptanedioate aldolase
MRKSKTLEKLRKGLPVIVPVIVLASSKITEIAGLTGFECLWLDTEHNCNGYDDIFHMIQGARAADTDCVVRIRKQGYSDYHRPLEDGAAGVIIPHCNSAEEARFAVRCCKYAPIGMRGIDGAGADADYTISDYDSYIKCAANETFIAVMIEEKEAVEAVEEIAAVKGVDILFIGTGDLSQSYGIPYAPDNAIIAGAIKKVASAAQKSCKWWGLPVGNPNEAAEYMKMGARFFAGGADLLILLNGFRKMKKDFSKL